MGSLHVLRPVAGLCCRFTAGRHAACGVGSGRACRGTRSPGAARRRNAGISRTVSLGWHGDRRHHR